MSNVFDVVLLYALPASGKSEVRNFMANLGAETMKEEFHIGENVQLDDFPYVHFMRRIDQELAKINEPRVFYHSDDDSFINDYDWGTLIHLLNEDYHDLVARNFVTTDSASKWLFKRIDMAAGNVNLPPRLGLLSNEVYEKIAVALEKDAREILDAKQNEIPDTLEGKTIVIESARGGKDGSSMPLSDPFGYQYAFRQLCPEILEKAAILYIWVTPEDSRRKNQERANPDDPGSNLFHGVPINVLLNDYGCDDMQYLIETSEVKDMVTVNAYGNTYHLPIGVFDNRVDQTSFLRADKENWDEEMVKQVTQSIHNATDTMYKNYKK